MCGLAFSAHRHICDLPLRLCAQLPAERRLSLATRTAVPPPLQLPRFLLFALSSPWAATQLRALYTMPRERNAPFHLFAARRQAERASRVQHISR